MKLKKIISGGQTGVDQAALQAAIDLGLAHGGWCPPGRTCEDGLIPDRFDLKETPEERNADAPDIPRSQRTAWNIRDADASLVILPDTMVPDPGTSWALDVANKLKKPTLTIDPKIAEVAKVRKWITKNEIKVLGVGGPSESTFSGIYHLTYQFLTQVFQPF